MLRISDPGGPRRDSHPQPMREPVGRHCQKLTLTLSQTPRALSLLL